MRLRCANSAAGEILGELGESGMENKTRDRNGWLKRAGSRWKTTTGEHILRLRAIALSDRWQAVMEKLHTTPSPPP